MFWESNIKKRKNIETIKVWTSSAFKSSIRITIVSELQSVKFIPKMHNSFTSSEEAAKSGK